MGMGLASYMASEKRGVQSWDGKERQAGLARTQGRGGVPWKYLQGGKAHSL